MNKYFIRGTVKIAGLTLAAVLGTTLVGCNSGNKGSGGGSASTGSSGDAIATIGNSQVTHSDLASFLEGQQGEQVLPFLIDTQLVFEALKEKGQEVTDADVQADLARRQEHDPSVTKVISQGGAKLDAIKLQIKREMALQELLTADVKATDEQVKSFFTKNVGYYNEPAKVKLGLIFASSKARADLLASQLAQKTKSFEALVIEQKNAKDPIANQSIADRGQFETLDNFPANIAAALQKLKKGDNSTPQQLNVGLPQPVFVIFHINEIQPVKKADLTALHSQVEMDYKLSQLAMKTVTQNPKNPPFAETVKRTQQFLHSQNPSGSAPSLHDVLAYINQSASTALLASLRQKGKVTVSDPSYMQVAEQYQATGKLPGAAGAPDAPGAAGAVAPEAGGATNSAPAKP